MAVERLAWAMQSIKRHRRSITLHQRDSFGGRRVASISRIHGHSSFARAGRGSDTAAGCLRGLDSWGHWLAATRDTGLIADNAQKMGSVTHE
jgi:hypothetical protein